MNWPTIEYQMFIPAAGSGMINAGEEDVPLLMPLRGNCPAAGENLVQQFNIRDALNSKLAPVRETAAAAFACRLIREEVRDALLNAIIVWLHDSRLIVV